MSQHVVAEQHTRLVAGEHPPAAGGRDAERAPVGVGVEGDGEVGTDPFGGGQQRVGDAGLLGVRERDRGEGGVRHGLGGDDVDVGEPGAGQREDGGLAADAVQRGERDPQRPRRAARERGDPVEVGLADVDDPARRPVGTETAGGAAAIAASISASAGGASWPPSST